MPVHCIILQQPKSATVTTDTHSTLTSTPTTWRFGLAGGVSALIESGFVVFPDFPPNTNNINLPFTGTISGGWFIQTLTAWQPKLLPFAVSFTAGLERKTSILTAPVPENGFVQSLQSVHSMTTVLLMPTLIIPIPILSLPFSVIGGIGLDMLISSSITPLVRLSTPGNPEQEYRTSIEPAPLRWSALAGVGYTWRITQFHQLLPTVELFPAFTIQTGTGLITQPGSTWNQVALRFSMAVLIPISPELNEPEKEPAEHLPLIPAIQTDALTNAKTSWLVVPQTAHELPHNQIMDYPVRNIVMIPDNPERHYVPETATPQPQLNTVQNFEYQTAKETNLSPTMKIFLDVVAQMMKARLQLTLRIIGHTDNAGTKREKQLVSEARALAAVRYLQNKGIARTRIFDTGVGDRQPIADNRSESGRSKNRRLEIIIVEQ